MNDIITALELHRVKEQFVRYCSFSLGIQQIRQATPHFDKLWVRRELHRVQEAYDLVVRYGSLPMHGVHAIGESVKEAQKDGTLRMHALWQIGESIRAVEAIHAYCKTSEIETPYLKELLDSLCSQREVAAHIEACISNHGDVLDHASPQLWQIRKESIACLHEMNVEVQRYIAHNASKLMDTITTSRHDRTCVLVKISEKNSVDGILHGESASGQTAYIEPRSFMILNNKLQSLKSAEDDEINRILFSLSQEVKGIANSLFANEATFALLDCIFAKAQWTKTNEGCVAQLNTVDTHMYMKQARHPLIPQEEAVCNTYVIKEPYRSVLITGSNTGGKTVTLKTIGLFVEMTLCGMPVAAQEAYIPMFDAIFVDIGDDQSIQESLSTFSSHIAKLAHITKNATAHSLVILDELGSGTDPREGEPLAVAILDDLRATHAMIIATTHFSALKQYATKHDDILLSSVEFDMETLRPTYRYIEGMSGGSNAFAIARRYGLKESILKMAIQRHDMQRDDVDKLMDKLEATLMENHTIKTMLEERLCDVKQLQATLEKEKNQFSKQKEALLLQVQEDAKKELAKKQEQADEIIAELQALQNDSKPHERIALKRKMAQLMEEEAVSDAPSDEVFQIHDYVLLRPYQYYGEIISMKKDKVCVVSNGIRMNVLKKDITHATRPTQKKKSERYTGKGIRHISMECNVIGMHVSEALPIVDKYLDDAILAHVYSVRLIHGVGTGALRKAIHAYLKRHASVESYAMGGQGEGGLGATIVTLKQKGG